MKEVTLMRNFEKFFVNNVENTLGRNSNKLERFSRGGVITYKKDIELILVANLYVDFT